MKKILALVLALLVAMSMTAAFAATDALKANGASGDTTSPYGDTTIEGTSFKVKLTDQSTVTAPGTQFSYTIANGTARAAVDANNPEIKTGEGKVTFTAGDNVTVGTPATTATVAMPSGINEVTVNLSFADHSAAGIYRYTVTQTRLDDSQTGAGFKTNKGDGAAIEYYLDVYVNKDGKVYATAMSTVDGTDTETQLKDAKKVDGFENLYSYGDDVETPESYDVTISKTLGNGGMEETTKAFPFTVSVKVPYDATYVQSNSMTFTIENGSTTFPASISTASDTNGNAVEITGALKGSESITIKGLPAGTIVQVKETTPATDNYNIAAKVEKMDETGAIETANFANPANSTTHTETAYATKGTVKANTTDDGAITYVNYRAAISPTGVVLRFAPYIAMLAGGVLLLVLARKRRSHKDED